MTLTAYSRFRVEATVANKRRQPMPNATPQMTVADYRAATRQKPRKYRNEKVVTPDGTFDSKKEHTRWIALQWQVKTKRIRDLRRQVRYRLFVQGEAGAVLICTYVADFVYECDGVTVVEDAKGFRTKEYRLKKKLMKAIHNIDIKEV